MARPRPGAAGAAAIMLAALLSISGAAGALQDACAPGTTAVRYPGQDVSPQENISQSSRSRSEESCLSLCTTHPACSSAVRLVRPSGRVTCYLKAATIGDRVPAHNSKGESQAAVNGRFTALGCVIASTGSCTGKPEPPAFSLLQKRVVIIGAGPAGLYFADRLQRLGITPIILEKELRYGGKTETLVTTESLPFTPHEMGTCYMHRGYDDVRALMREYGIPETEEVQYGGSPEDVAKVQNYSDRVVYDLAQDPNATDMRRVGPDGTPLSVPFSQWLVGGIVQGILGNATLMTDPVKLTWQLATEVGVAAERVHQVRERQNFIPAKMHNTRESCAAAKPDKFLQKKLEELDELEGSMKRMQKALPCAKYEDETAFAASVESASEALPVQQLVSGLALVRLLTKAMDYMLLHMDLLQYEDVQYGLPTAESAAKAAADTTARGIKKSFGQWLQDNDFQQLEPFFTYSQSAQGYGALDEVPALYGLWWNHPVWMIRSLLPARWPFSEQSWQENLGAFIAGSQEPSLVTLKSGFSGLWDAMVDSQRFDIRLGCSNVKITQRPSGGRGGPSQVTFQHEGQQLTLEADYVVVTAPFKTAMDGPEPLFAATREERDVFSKLQTLTLKTTLCSADPDAAAIPDAAGHLWAGPLRRLDRRLRYVRYSRLALGDLSAVGDATSTARPRFIAYQGDNQVPTKETDADMLRILREDLETAGMTNVSVIAQRAWPYFPHFSNEALFPPAQGGCDSHSGSAVLNGPWAILELQGRNGIVFAGSSACYESVVDVISYTELLFSKFGVA